MSPQERAETRRLAGALTTASNHCLPRAAVRGLARDHYTPDEIESWVGGIVPERYHRSLEMRRALQRAVAVVLVEAKRAYRRRQSQPAEPAHARGRSIRFGRRRG